MTSIPSKPSTPKARLAASREALIRQMMPEGGSTNNSSNRDVHGTNDACDSNQQSAGSSIWQIAKQTVLSWWQHHPAHLAVDVGRPYLSNYAQRKPFQMLGIAVGVGALAVLVKPWRLISATGLAALAIKSTNLPATLLSLVASSGPTTRATSSPQHLKDNP